MRLPLAAATIALSITASHAGDLSITPKFDPRDILNGHEKEAAYTTSDAKRHTVTWTSSAVDLPDKDKHNDTCARIPEYMDGMICYKLCGGSLAAEPIDWNAQWRVANMGHNTGFAQCNGRACKAFNPEYYPGPKRGCLYFGFFKGAKHPYNQADMRVIVTLRH